MRLLPLLALILLRASDPLTGPVPASGRPSAVAKDAPVAAVVTRSILRDEENRVPAAFSISPYFEPHVRFWFSIYTRYGSREAVLHDRDNPGIVYGVVGLMRTEGEDESAGRRHVLLQRRAGARIAEVKEALLGLARGLPAEGDRLLVLRALRDAGRNPPPRGAARSNYFRHLTNGVRAQTGQRDLIEAGLHREAPFRPFLTRLSHEFHLPPQLMAIPFLESSFNNAAHSSAGAAGVWQFMPLIASFFMPKREARWDYRLNPVVSSVAAMHLLRENHRILKRWDLAVTAYNSGTKHLVRARREIGHPAPSLERVFRSYRGNHHGFASKNFYAEFLALVHAIAYQDRTFPRVSTPREGAADKLFLTVARCAFIPQKMAARLGIHGESWLDLNRHLRRPASTYPRGTIVAGSLWLPPGTFQRLEWAEMVKLPPKRWASRLRGQSCSTK